MNKIKVLPQELADKIAAGEVVERPASAVKELVENALDAASTEVEITVEDSGRKLISISDDGEGMSKEDIVLACRRYATSKIKNSADLNKIETLGFRGEALASIAAVSFLSICSKTEEDSAAWKLEIKGAKENSLTQGARTRGTTVEIRNLFFNTPARLKFLKSPSTEMFHIIKIVSELAMAYPQVSFKLKNKLEEVIDVARHNTIKERAAVLLGEELVKELIPISFKIPPLKIEGLVARPGFGQSNRNNQYIFVNRRPVVDRTISHAVSQGYYSLLPEKEYPPFILFIEIPPESVDVNVHPTKREIRLRDSSLLHDIIVKAVRDTLTYKESANVPFGKENTPQTFSSQYRAQYTPVRENYAGENLHQEFSFGAIKDAPVEKEIFPGIGQIQNYLQAGNTYLIGQDKEGVIIIDQHAAHERVLFDGLLAQQREKKIEKQKLLLPLNLKLSKAQGQLIHEHKELFHELGFEVEEFGKDAFVVQAYPAVLEKADIAAVIQNALDELAQTQLSADIEHKIKQLLAPIACHSAVRAGETLGPRQIETLVERLWNTPLPYTCPHGRPTMIKLKWAELEKKFKRK